MHKFQDRYHRVYIPTDSKWRAPNVAIGTAADGGGNLCPPCKLMRRCAQKPRSVPRTGPRAQAGRYLYSGYNVHCVGYHESVFCPAAYPTHHHRSSEIGDKPVAHNVLENKGCIVAPTTTRAELDWVKSSKKDDGLVPSFPTDHPVLWSGHLRERQQNSAGDC
jgi:hypothetical protein